MGQGCRESNVRQTRVASFGGTVGVARQRLAIKDSNVFDDLGLVALGEHVLHPFNFDPSSLYGRAAYESQGKERSGDGPQVEDPIYLLTLPGPHLRRRSCRDPNDHD